MRDKNDCNTNDSDRNSYPQAVIANGIVYTSGLLPIKLLGDTFVEGDIFEQTRQVLINLKEALESVGSDLDRVIKTTVFIRSYDDLNVIDEIYATYFSGIPHARANYQAILPLGALIQLEATARV